MGRTVCGRGGDIVPRGENEIVRRWGTTVCDGNPVKNVVLSSFPCMASIPNLISEFSN